MLFSQHDLYDVIDAGKTLEDVLKPPRNDFEFEQKVALLDDLVEIVNNDDHHPLAPLARVIGNLVSEYETLYTPKNYPAEPLLYMI